MLFGHSTSVFESACSLLLSKLLLFLLPLVLLLFFFGGEDGLLLLGFLDSRGHFLVSHVGVLHFVFALLEGLFLALLLLLSTSFLLLLLELPLLVLFVRELALVVHWRGLLLLGLHSGLRVLKAFITSRLGVLEHLFVVLELLRVNFGCEGRL